MRLSTTGGMHKKRLFALLLGFIALLAGCQRLPATATPVAVPTRIVVRPSPTSLPTSETSGPRTGPATAADVPRITPEKLHALLASARNVIVIDVRGSEAYAEGHILGAVNLPYDDLVLKYQQLPRNVKIVLYCS